MDLVKSKKLNFCIIIPAYNEDKNIRYVLTDVMKYVPKKNIIVVDDGSTDTTPLVAERAGIILVSNPKNIGIGGALKTGFKEALKRKYDAAVQIDADGQHNPADLSRIIDELHKGTDLVIGSRYLEKNDYRTPLLRSVGIRIFSFLILLGTGRLIKDTTSGLRGYSKKALKLFSQHHTDIFPEPESIALAIRKNLLICEVPAFMNQRLHGKSSLYLLRFIYVMISSSFGIIRVCLQKNP